MPVFLEKFVLPVLAASIIAVIVLNPLKFDYQQRWALLVGVLAFAYFIGHTLHKSKPTPAQAGVPAIEAAHKNDATTEKSNKPTLEKPHPSHNTGPATTSGPKSPAITGDKNSVTYGEESR